MVDVLVAHDAVVVLDVGHVLDIAVTVDEVNVSIGVGHKELALAFIVTNGTDADVRQAIDFVEDIDGIVLRVIIKQLVLRGGVNLVSNRLNANHFLIGKMGAPVADGDTVLGHGK